MSHIKSFTFNAFGENTYVISDEDLSCVIIDPGCHQPLEEKQLIAYIEKQKLTPKYLINTHAHLDHIFGNQFVKDHFDIPIIIHKDELDTLRMAPMIAANYGLNMTPSPEPDQFVEDGDVITFGQTSFLVLFTPGHSFGEISLYNEKEGYLIAGDVLFSGSIGRTDLPGGDFDTLEKSIREKFYCLPDETVVYCGHGIPTTIGKEKNSNPFVKG